MNNEFRKDFEKKCELIITRVFKEWILDRPIKNEKIKNNDGTITEKQGKLLGLLVKLLVDMPRKFATSSKNIILRS